jgi:hypothetical protein
VSPVRPLDQGGGLEGQDAAIASHLMGVAFDGVGLSGLEPLTSALSEWSRHALCCRQPPCEGLHAAPAGADDPPVAHPAAFSLLTVPVRFASSERLAGPGTYLASAEGLQGSVRLLSCVDMSVGNKDRYDLHRHCRPTSSLHRTRALQPTERREWRGYRCDGLALVGGALRHVTLATRWQQTTSRPPART